MTNNRIVKKKIGSELFKNVIDKMCLQMICIYIFGIK